VTSASGEANGCIFCKTTEPGREELILVRGRTAFVILNLYPYNSGHLMVVPNRHVPTLHASTADELAEAYKPQGINIGINLGRPAGAGVLDHLHVHVVPRWNGDTNFMTVTGETRVLPESLSATRDRLRPIFERLARHDA